MQPGTHPSKRVFCWGPPLPRGPHPSRPAPRRLDEEPGQQTIRLRGKFKERGGDLQGQRLFVVCVEVFWESKSDGRVRLARNTRDTPSIFAMCWIITPAKLSYPPIFWRKC
ncbi:hypothetical protein TNCT_398651 [Trichonephila clavata]|uniref:Uncharacterized protein n=1 Tax=Trichonephila clavata TaxID=2740835 RepID=A0A8X6FG22_TRICU|nr:hypothetical protein TNCT_398651 [Trichonephila clavata]